MNYPETGGADAAAVSLLLGMPRFGAGVGLHRMLPFLEALPSADWLKTLDAIRVTGSKGKGSVSVFCSEILRHLGFATGLFTSPHLIHFHERMRIDRRPIGGDDLVAAVNWFDGLRHQYERLQPGDRVGAFEGITAVALHHFCERRVAAVVAEAGIGGRYDPTRVIPGRIVALTSVELEHTALLGDSLELIAYNKADLCRPGGTLVLGEVDADVCRRLRGYCRVLGVELVEAGRHSQVSGVSFEDHTMRFSMTCDGLRMEDLTCALVGDHQARNAALAALTVRRWLSHNRKPVADAVFEAAVRRALSAVEWPGRLQRVRTQPEIVVDVGHTQQSARAAAQTMRQLRPGAPILLVAGISTDKDVAGILSKLVPIATQVICTRARHKGADPAVLARRCEEIAPGIVWKTTDEVRDALDLAIDRALTDGMIVLVAGGLFLAAEAIVCLRGDDPSNLRFF